MPLGNASIFGDIWAYTLILQGVKARDKPIMGFEPVFIRYQSQ